MIKEIEILNFRNFEKGLKISLSKNMTVISGKNGTSKTTLLGMIAKPFKGNEKDIYNNDMSGTFSEIFKINPEYDKENRKDPIYIIYPNDKFEVQKNSGEIEQKDNAPAYIIRRNNEKLRIWTSSENTAGGGQRLYPVIYLGLKRLYPIAEIENKDLNAENDLLSEEEKKNFIRDYKKILNIQSSLEVDRILNKKNTKNSILVKGEDFGGITNSSGQDNIGQILGAIYSYKRLKKNGNYKGGLLLIDEIESSLHPDTQIKIIDYLIKESKNLDIQVVLTTHSFEIIEYIVKKTEEKNRKDLTVNYLYKKNNKIKNMNINSMELLKIKNNLYNEKIGNKKVEKKKIKIFYEDDVAVKWGKELIKGFRSEKYKLEHIPLNMSYTQIRNLSEHLEGIKILDGDVKENDIMKLPMDYAVEEEVYHFLMKEEVLEEIEEEYGYLDARDKIFDVSKNPLEQVDKITTDHYKTWYNGLEKNTGLSVNNIIKLWKKMNKEKIEQFKTELKNKIKDWPKG